MFGERPEAKEFSDLDPVHQFAYILATKISKGANALDYGCGYGSGTTKLADFYKKVIAYDINQDSILTARTYHKYSNIQFVNTIPTNVKFDLIVSFQVIEHIKPTQVKKYVDQLHQILNKEGLLIISTPNKSLTSPGLKLPIMPFHEKEYTYHELKNLLSKNFNVVSIWGQKSTNIRLHQSTKNINKFLRIISQYQVVRLLAKIIPTDIKSHLLGYHQYDTKKFRYQLVKSQKLVKRSEVLIAICKKPRLSKEY